MPLAFIVQTYHQARPDLSVEEIEFVVGMAVHEARAKHPDFDRFLPGIEFLSTVFFTDHTKMPLSDYIETLYCGVKHADFTRPWRAQLKTPAPPAPVN